MEAVQLTVSPDGVLTLPESLRQSLGLEGGGLLLAREEEGRLVLDTVEARVARARAIIQKYIPPGTRLVDQFIAEKRIESERE